MTTTPVGEAWRAAKRRRAVFAAFVTAGCFALAFWFFTLPTWRKLAARDWPSAPAKIEKITKTFSDGRDWIITGRTVKLTFTFTDADGVARTGRQDVSGKWAARHDISADGYYRIREIGLAARPWEVDCWYDPRDPSRAVVERSLAHADVPALLPLLVLVFGVIMVGAERRFARDADDAETRLVARNNGRWNVRATGSSLGATSRRDPIIELGTLIAAAVVDWPAISVDVNPHPVPRGEPTQVRISASGRRRSRRVRVRMMAGPFSMHGRPRNARWSADVFDGRLARDVTESATIVLPRLADLPAGCDDCWLRVSVRARLGYWWSRPLWLAVAADAGR